MAESGVHSASSTKSDDDSDSCDADPEFAEEENLDRLENDMCEDDSSDESEEDIEEDVDENFWDEQYLSEEVINAATTGHKRRSKYGKWWLKKWLKYNQQGAVNCQCRMVNS